ncbi:ankyrin repeat domain-containing protein [Aspergillus tanneri]|uniref:Uncharacterized protein n=1 Tax=Aspergillus tanneri TaxID=1220188 RepID=A0A5M9MJP1_9EURO|nr:uncharacterized protein ATNIH1004_005915 [Aspergillus tanneri]KAA8647225.1 hypothetical protein ATNIH1004_005915 [Aspergillus tanneri]
METSVPRWLKEENRDLLNKDFVNINIRTYIRGVLWDYDEFRRLQWAACQINILQGYLNLRQLRKALSAIPRTLEGTYGRILRSIKKELRDDAIRLLRFLIHAQRPLTLEEAVDGIALDPDFNPLFDPKLRLPDPQEITRVACQAGQEEVAGILDQGVDVNAKGGADVHAHSAACHGGDTEKIRTLLGFGFLSDHYGDDAFQTACRYGQETIFQILSSDLSSRQDVHGKALRGAMYGGHKKIVASLLNDVSENPPPANFVNSSLQVTAFLGNHDFVGMLLDYGAAKGRGDFLGNTLQAASHHRDEKIFHQLLEKGPDVNGKGGQLWESSPGRVISRPSDDCSNTASS